MIKVLLTGPLLTSVLALLASCTQKMMKNERYSRSVVNLFELKMHEMSYQSKAHDERSKEQISVYEAHDFIS